MSDKIVKQTDLFEQVQSTTELEGMKKYLQFLNKEPSKKNIKVNNDVQYLPIGYIEKLLDEVFKGCWSYTIVSSEVKLNSCVVTIELKVIHPNGFVITRGGIGAVPVQLKKGEVEINPENINPMALQKCFPSAKSYALSNAAQSLGDIFGRNLMRKDGLYEVGFYDDEITDQSILKNEALSLLRTSNYDEAMKSSTKKTIEKSSNEKLKDIIEYLKTKQ